MLNPSRSPAPEFVMEVTDKTRADVKVRKSALNTEVISDNCMKNPEIQLCILMCIYCKIKRIISIFIGRNPHRI